VDAKVLYLNRTHQVFRNGFNLQHCRYSYLLHNSLFMLTMKRRVW